MSGPNNPLPVTVTPNLAASLEVVTSLRAKNFDKKAYRIQAEKLLELRQLLFSKGEIFTADDAAIAASQLLSGDIKSATRRIRLIELRLGILKINDIDHINAGLIASIFTIIAICSIALPASASMAFAMLGGGLGGLLYVALQLIPDRTHTRGPQDVLSVLWRTVGAALFGIVVYGLEESHILHINVGGIALNWGLFSVSAMSGFVGKLATDLVGALRK